ncbi:MAG TPA: hypothetical protein VJL83_02005 [Patescibacteria group bacterium]|nr:hypothetical protein [Patescibacteria group bacterium]
MPEGGETVEGQQITMPDSHRDVEARPPIDGFTIADIKGGSTVMSLEMAAGIRLGKIKPAGYDEAAKFFRTEYENTTNAHCVWLAAEAETAGKYEEMRREFPDVPDRLSKILNHLAKNSPGVLIEINNRLQREDYSIEELKKFTAMAGDLAKRLLGNIKKSSEGQ